VLHPGLATLEKTPRPHLGLGGSRLETLAFLILAMISARRVNLGHLAAKGPARVAHGSTCRRPLAFLPGSAPAEGLGGAAYTNGP
jgi:hypothetical protein